MLVKDPYTRSEENVARFCETFGSIGKVVLDVFNTYDFHKLDLRHGGAPEDEYLSYVQRFTKMLLQVPESERTETKIARLLFITFRPEEFLGITNVCKVVGVNKELQVVYSSFDTPSITIEDVIALAKNIFAELKRASIRVVVDNTKKETKKALP